MNCIIIEDQHHAQLVLENYIAQVQHLQLVGTFYDCTEAMEVLNQLKVELLFLDVSLPKISGTEFLKTLKNAPQVILTTAYSEYALEGYELNVVDYLLKPFSFQRFLKAVTKAFGRPEINALDPKTPEDDYVYIKVGQGYRKVDFVEIIRISTDMDCSEIYLSKDKIVSNESLKYWCEKLPGQRFIRIHKSHIVNKSKIKKVEGNQIYLLDDLILPLGRSYRDDFFKKVLKQK